MKFPLKSDAHTLSGCHPGAFGARRKHDVHTGVDLYVPDGSLVVAVESGIVVAVENFTGPEAGSPWWLSTMALLVEGPSGVICYGEIATNHAIGDPIYEGMIIGEVRRVLRHDKGLPTTMLHFELYEKGTKQSVIWKLDDPKPQGLLNPTDLLHEARLAQEDEKETMRHGHGNYYVSNCLLCNPLHEGKESASFYIITGVLLLLSLTFGFVNFLIGQNHGTMEAFPEGLSNGVVISFWLIAIAVGLFMAANLVVGIVYTISQIVVHTGQFFKYLYLRAKFRNDND